jgi:two-component system LytT family sensor kinase
MKTSNTNILKKLKTDFIVCTKLTFVLGFVFILINQEFTVKGVSLTLLISAMYSFTLGFGNGMINEYLNSKWDWVKETNKRVWIGVFTTAIYTGIAVLIIHYVQYIYSSDIKLRIFSVDIYFGYIYLLLFFH